MDGAKASSSPPGRSWQGLLEPVGEKLGFSAHDFLFTIEEVRADDAQMFVNRSEEDRFVASFHFPPTSGKARQIKIVVPIRDFIKETAPGSLQVDTEKSLDEQALINFEQICFNFMLAVLPVLRKSAYLLSQLNPQRESAAAVSDESLSDHDDREEYIVNVSSGWPLARPRFRLFDVVRLHSAIAHHDVQKGYLVRVKDVENNIGGKGAEYRAAIAAHRAASSEEAHARLRPKPTDLETFLATSEGRKFREQIVADIATVANIVFPPTPGRPLARSEEETTALAAELREDFNQRSAKYVGLGKKKKRGVIFEEMANEGRYGPGHDSLSAASIEKLIAKRPKRPDADE